MNRKLRITFRNGDARMGEFPPGQTLPQLWSLFKRDGAIVGDSWCAQFDFVAMIEVVETTGGANEQAAEQGQAMLPRGIIGGLVASMGAGSFKPPGEA